MRNLDHATNQGFGTTPAEEQKMAYYKVVKLYRVIAGGP